MRPERSGEILALEWGYLDRYGINVPGSNTKNGKDRVIALTGEIETILGRRKKDISSETGLIFHHDGNPISDHRKCWQTANFLRNWTPKSMSTLREKVGEPEVHRQDLPRFPAQCGSRNVEGWQFNRWLHENHRP